jgi:adenylosuccinate synthase
MGKVQIIVGGQFGSEGKGMVAGHLASKFEDLTAMRVAGPNAGHTVLGRCPPGCNEVPVGEPDPAHAPESHPWKLQQIPVAAVTSTSARLLIGPGSEIHLPTLFREVDSLDAAGYRVSDRLVIDPGATMLEAAHVQQETAYGLVAKIGSTGKGVGAARAARLMREARLAIDEPAIDDWIAVPGFAQQVVHHGGNLQIEGTQGYGLGLHAGFYPHCTSSDCTAIDFMSMAGISPWSDAYLTDLEIWIVFRAYPIRVAGESGPLFKETTWGALNLPGEFTTVTGRERRVGAWDGALAGAAMSANGYPSSALHVAMTMVDQVWPHLKDHKNADAFSSHVWNWIHHHSVDLMQVPELIGTGPASVVELPVEGRPHP